MVSVEDPLPHSNSSRFPLTTDFYGSSSPSAAKIHRQVGRSMGTVRSNFYQSGDQSCPLVSDKPGYAVEYLYDSVIDMRLGELALKNSNSVHSTASFSKEEAFLDISQAFSDFSACSSDISGDLHRLTCLPLPGIDRTENNDGEEEDAEPCLGFVRVKGHEGDVNF